MKKYFTLLIGIMIGIQGFNQNNFTIANIFDYEIGDIFQYQTEYQSGGAGEQVEITNKFYSVNQDTLFYERHILSWNADAITQTTIYEDLQDTIYYTNLNSLLEVTHIGAEPITIIYEENNCSDSIAFFDFTNSTESEYEVIEYKYGIGLGKTSFLNAFSSDNYSYLESLSYYSKTDKTCGVYSPVFETININEIEKYNVFSIFPNPAKNSISIKTNDNVASLCEIYNTSGLLIKSISLGSNEIIIQVTDLVSGLYLVRIGKNVQKLIIE